MSASERHSHLLHPNTSILIVVDMQEPFLRLIHDRERIIDNIRRLIQGAAILRVPIVSTLQNRNAMGDLIPELRDLLPPTHVPFEKMTFSCYADAQFAAELHRVARKQVVLCGVESHICVSQTALDLISGGYQAHLCADAVSSRTRENWLLGIEKVRQAGGVLTGTESVLFEMLEAAGTNEFREILKIVK